MRKLLFCTFLLVIFANCSTKKIVQPVPELSKADIIQLLLDRNINFKWFDAKMNAYIDSPDEKVSGSIHAKIIKDTSMIISLKKFGIEAARVFADKENYTILYRFDAAYESGTIDQIKRILTFSADLQDLQQLLVGNIILPDTSHTQIVKDTDHYILTSDVDDLKLQYFVDARQFQVSKMYITDNSNRTATIQFDDYREVAGVGKVAFKRNFTVPYNGNGTASMELKFSNIEVDRPFAIKFSIPSNYERLH